MANTSRVAVVTGGNKGIGHEIARGLCKRFDGVVYLTSRDESRGKEAVEKLEKDGHSPKYHQLDIDSTESINTFKDYISKTYGGLDVLVNNAGIAYKMTTTAPAIEQAENTVKTNYFGTLNVCNALFPLLRPHARVVQVSSSAGMLKHVQSQEIKDKFLNEELTVDGLSQLMNQFVQDVRDGVQKERGWSPSNYSMSKIGLTKLTFIQQKMFDSDPREDLIVNAVHPGYIGTDMSSYKGPGTTEEGARAPLHCALLPPDAKEPKGAFIWEDSTVLSWV